MSGIANAYALAGHAEGQLNCSTWRQVPKLTNFNFSEEHYFILAEEQTFLRKVVA
jgi:hypothetical protein